MPDTKPPITELKEQRAITSEINIEAKKVVAAIQDMRSGFVDVNIESKNIVSSLGSNLNEKGKEFVKTNAMLWYSAIFTTIIKKRD